MAKKKAAEAAAAAEELAEWTAQTEAETRYAEYKAWLDTNKPDAQVSFDDWLYLQGYKRYN